MRDDWISMVPSRKPVRAPGREIECRRRDERAPEEVKYPADVDFERIPPHLGHRQPCSGLTLTLTALFSGEVSRQLSQLLYNMPLF